jgi:hypothetical protein
MGVSPMVRVRTHIGRSPIQFAAFAGPVFLKKGKNRSATAYRGCAASV